MPSASEIDRAVFGAKKKAGPVPANDPHDRSFEIEVDSEEATHLVERASGDRRKKGGERRRNDDRRASDERRGKSDYTPLPKVNRGYRAADDGKRGPLLLVGALLIVAVFSVVVWNAYREGVRPEDSIETVPELASAGAFKTPPRELSEAKVAAAPDAEVLEQLEGPPSVAVASQDVRAEAPPAKPPAAAIAPPAATPAAKAVPPVLPTAPPPTPLKQPVVTMAAAKPPAAKPPAAKPETAISLTPAPSQAIATKPAAPAAVVVPAPTPAATYKPTFSALGAHVVQIAAPSTQAGAVAEWDKRAKASPELFASAERFIVQADVNGKTVYRLRAGPFATKAEADSFCSAFKAKGGNCFPAAK
jgi:hypothetical protein